MRAALVLLGALLALIAVDTIAFRGLYRETAWNAAQRQAAEVTYEIQYWIARASRRRNSRLDNDSPLSRPQFVAFSLVKAGSPR